MDEQTRLNAEKHPEVETERFTSLASYALYLKHLAAYEFAARLAEGKVVLDVGCNVGYGTNLIAKGSLRTLGVDVSQTAVAEAERRYASDNLQFLHFDGGRLPAEDHSFDLVCSCQVIEHIGDMHQYLSEIRRVLAPGGQVVFTTPNASIRLDPGMKPWNRFHVQEFRAVELEALLLPWFDSVEIKGLFATKELYDSEIERCNSARAGVRAQQIREMRPLRRLQRSVVGLAKKTIPQGAAEVLRDRMKRKRGGEAAAHGQESSLDAATLKRYSTADFRYEDDRLEAAMDLMAVCGIDESPVEAPG